MEQGEVLLIDEKAGRALAELLPANVKFSSGREADSETGAGGRCPSAGT